MREFINLSNHRSDNWSNAQRQAAETYGEIVDIPFPQIYPQADSEEIDILVNEYLEILSKHDISAIMLQGEYVFTFRLAVKLKAMGMTVLSACTERRTKEIVDETGKTHKTSEFEFVRFREY